MMLVREGFQNQMESFLTLTSVDSDYDWILEDIIESPNEEMQKIVGAVRGIHSYANTYIPKENFDRVAIGWDAK